MIYAVGLIVTFLLMLLLVRPGMRGCRWREHRSEGVWRCAACGAISEDAPKRCLRDR